MQLRDSKASFNSSPRALAKFNRFQQVNLNLYLQESHVMSVMRFFGPVVLCIMIYKVLLIFASVNKYLGVTIQMKAAEQYFYEVLFIIPYKVVLHVQSVPCRTVVYRFL